MYSHNPPTTIATQPSSREKEHYYVFDSSHISSESDMSQYQIHFTEPLRNIKSIEIVSALIPRVSSVDYICLKIDEVPQLNSFGVKLNSDTSNSLYEYKVFENTFSKFNYTDDVGKKEYFDYGVILPAKKEFYPPMSNLSKMSLSWLQKSDANQLDASLVDFGSESEVDLVTFPDRSHSITFKIITT